MIQVKHNDITHSTYNMRVGSHLGREGHFLPLQKNKHILKYNVGLNPSQHLINLFPLPLQSEVLNAKNPEKKKNTSQHFRSECHIIQ